MNEIVLIGDGSAGPADDGMWQATGLLAHWAGVIFTVWPWALIAWGLVAALLLTAVLRYKRGYGWI